MEFYNIKVVLVGEHYEVFCDGKMVCKKCWLSSIKLGSKIDHTETLYPEWFQV